MPMIPGQGMSPYPDTIQIPGDGGGQPAPEAAPEAQQSPDEMISMALDMIRQALSADGDLSEAERLTIEKVTTMLQQIPAGREKEQQAALGGGPATNFLRRNSGA